MNYSQEQKQDIATRLSLYVRKYQSQRKAATALGIAAATMSAILNEDWDKISDTMWTKVDGGISMLREDWQIAETIAYRDINFALDDAQSGANVTWVVGDAGCGKTTSARHYAATHDNAYYILCAEDTKRSDFVRDMAKVMGIRVNGSTREMLEQVLEALNRVDMPLLIFDEADKLQDSVMQYFITIYNRTEGNVGIVFLSTQHIKRRMESGLRYNKRGYNELHSRFGRKFFEVSVAKANDIYAVCAANGITDDHTIALIIKEVAEYDNDMRRVRRVIRRELKRRAA